VHLFVALRQLSVFKQYTLWKCMRLWRNAVRRTHVAAAKKVLKARLYFMHDTLRTPLLRLHKLCLEAADIRLHCLKPGKV
jgi:hypothetical protein